MTKNETPMGRKRLTPEKIVNRIRWVKALLSGEYEQQRDGALHNYDGWCCLGVAGHVLEPNAAFLDEDAVRCFLPKKWAHEKFGLSGHGGAIGEEKDQDIAARWNDVRNLDFNQIADRVALATEKAQRLDNVTSAPELDGLVPGTYAREWLKGIK